jgi:hypothetical protein
MPDHKKKMNYRYESKKFEVAGLTPIASDLVKAPRAKECPVQLEAVVENIRPFGENDPGRPFPAVAIEMRIVRVHVHESLVVTGNPNRIDPEKWTSDYEFSPILWSWFRCVSIEVQRVPRRNLRSKPIPTEPVSLDSVEADILAA